MNRVCASVFLVAFSASHVAAQSATTAPPVDLDAWVARAMNTFHTPGRGLSGGEGRQAGAQSGVRRAQNGRPRESGCGDTFRHRFQHEGIHRHGAPPKDYIAAFEAVKTRREKEAKDTVAKAGAARNRESRPSLPLEKYAGLYRDVWYGEATVGVVEGRLNTKFARSAGLNGTLEHSQYDTFIAKWAERTVPDAYVTFSTETDWGIRDLCLKAVSPLADISYDSQDLLFLPVGRQPFLCGEGSP